MSVQQAGPQQFKVVIAGPYGAGKTTMIESISEVQTLSTEKSITGGPTGSKTSTTVALDFGRITIGADDPDGGLVLMLFGTPGQSRFEFMWRIVSEGMLGFIILVDAEREDSYEEARDVLEFFQQADSEVPYIVAVNKVDDVDADEAVAQARADLKVPDGVRVVTFDARERESVKDTLLTLLMVVLNAVNERETAVA